MVLFVVHFLTPCAAWYDGEQHFLASSTASGPAPILLTPHYAGELAIAAQMHLEPTMYWSDTRTSAVRDGAEFVEELGGMPTAMSWTGEERGLSVNYTILVRRMQIEVTKPKHAVGFITCRAMPGCSIPVLAGDSDRWAVFSPLTRDKQHWEQLLSSVIPKPMFASMQTPQFVFRDAGVGVWTAYFKRMHLLLSGTLVERGSRPRRTPFTARFPVAKGNTLVGVVGLINYCQKGERVYHERLTTKTLQAMILRFCGDYDNLVLDESHPFK